MQRGDRVLWTAILGGVFIIAVVSVVVMNNGATGKVYETYQFIPEARGEICGRVICESVMPPYFLGMKGTFAGCCCPEDYKGGREGWCTNPIYVSV